MEGSLSGSEQLEIPEAFASSLSVEEVVEAICEEENTRDELRAGTEASTRRSEAGSRLSRCSRTRLCTLRKLCVLTCGCRRFLLRLVSALRGLCGLVHWARVSTWRSTL